MSIRTQTIHGLIFAACAWCVSGCEEEKNTAQAATKNPHPAASLSAQKATRPEPPPAPEPKRECPDGTMAEGTFNKPCEGKGATRMMEVTYKKTTDEGPQFRVISKSKQVILYGRIAVYFYDKAGKQMETKDESGKSKPYHTCFGKNLFAGVVKPSEKLFLNFSCVKKQDVPDGVKDIEGEMQMVGFSGEDGEKVDFYWRNNDLTPDARPKGGVK